jgi:hypothetical protein
VVLGFWENMVEVLQKIWNEEGVWPENDKFDKKKGGFWGFENVGGIFVLNHNYI